MRRLALLRDVVAVAIGAVGTAVGAGVGVRHLSTSGIGATAVAAAFCGVLGVVLLVWGFVDLLRLLPGWWRLLAVPGALALLAFVVLPLAVAFAVVVVPPTELDRATPRDRGLEYDDVTFETEDGVTLSGWYLPSADGAAVVLMHGATSTRSNVLDEAEVLNEAGYGALMFDARGHGESGGTAMDFGWYGDQDTAAAVTWLAERADVDPGRIGAVGLSMGGEQAIGAADDDARVRAVVAEGATGRVRADKGWLPHHVGGWLQRGIDWVQYTATDLLTDADPPPSLRSSVRAIAPRPVLLVVGGDVPDEQDAARYLVGGAPEAVEVWEVDGAGHTDGLETDPSGWRDEVVGFLDEALAG